MVLLARSVTLSVSRRNRPWVETSAGIDTDTIEAGVGQVVRHHALLLSVVSFVSLNAFRNHVKTQTLQASAKARARPPAKSAR